MAAYKREVKFDAANEMEAAAVVTAITTILDSIKDKKHLIELGKIVGRKPNLIEKGIPYLKYL